MCRDLGLARSMPATLGYEEEQEDEVLYRAQSIAAHAIFASNWFVSVLMNGLLIG